MKKISKVNIEDKSMNMKWYKKILFILLFCMLIIMITALVRFYSDVNKEDNQAYLDPNIISGLDSNKSNYEISKNDDGMLGVIDGEERTVIEPQWSNIYFLNSSRFAVQKKINNKLLMGIIDSEENFITPFIYKKFISIEKSYLAGYFADEEGFSLFDTSGNLVSDKKWLDYQYDINKKNLVLTDQYGNCSYTNENGILECIGFSMAYTMQSGSYCSVEFNTDEKSFIELVGYDNTHEMFRIFCTYLEAIISNNMSKISDITNEKFYSSLSSNDIFKQCQIKKISDIKIEESNDEKNAYILSAEITYDYFNKDKRITDLKSLISLTIIKENNLLILKSINKEEL